LHLLLVCRAPTEFWSSCPQSEGQASGLTGQLTHSLFEQALTLGTFDTGRLDAEAAAIVASRVEDL
jgi:hypothetical protein